MRRFLALATLLVGLLPPVSAVLLWWTHRIYTIGLPVQAHIPFLALGLADAMLIGVGIWLGWPRPISDEETT